MKKIKKKRVTRPRDWRLTQQEFEDLHSALSHTEARFRRDNGGATEFSRALSKLEKKFFYPGFRAFLTRPEKKK